MKLKIQRLALPAIVCLTALNAHAGVVFGPGAVVFESGVLFDEPNATFQDDYTVPEGAGVLLFHGYFNFGLSYFDASLEVDGGSTLDAGYFLATTTTDPTLTYRSDITVKDPGSLVRIGSNIDQTGRIVLRGWGEFDITDAGVVNWVEDNNCDGVFVTCDILIGATGKSNTGIRVKDFGSLLDASNTNGRLFVGFVPSTVSYDPVDPELGGAPDSEDFFVVEDGGTVLSNGGAVGKGFEPAFEGDEWNTGVGFVHGTAFINNGGAWYLTQGSLEDGIDLNVGEGDGGSGNVIVANGGLLDVTANPGGEAGIYLGQRAGGGGSVGGSNLLLIDGAGSTVNVDDNADFFNGSRIANGFATVQNEGALVIDSTVFVIDGTSDAPLSLFNTELASRAAGITGLSNKNLDVLSGGSVAITDTDAQGINALLIAPGGLSTEFASVRVSGVGSSITVSNDPGVAKIPLDAFFEEDDGSEFIPIVSNIGTGTLDIEAGGAVNFENGDFVIAARAGDDADVLVAASTLTADRVVVGWADYEGGLVPEGASSGTLTLDIGIINGDVVVDDNGTLNGIGAINGTLFGEGGVIAPGFSPGTITVESLILGLGSKLFLQVGLSPDGTIDTAASDAIVATSGDLDLSAGDVTIELYVVDDGVGDPPPSLQQVLAEGEPLAIDQVLTTTSGSLTVTSVTVEDSSGVPVQNIEVVNVFNKAACKDDGWESLFRSDESEFKNQGDCIQYVNTGK